MTKGLIAVLLGVVLACHPLESRGEPCKGEMLFGSAVLNIVLTPYETSPQANETAATAQALLLLTANELAFRLASTDKVAIVAIQDPSCDRKKLKDRLGEAISNHTSGSILLVSGKIREDGGQLNLSHSIEIVGSRSISNSDETESPETPIQISSVMERVKSAATWARYHSLPNTSSNSVTFLSADRPVALFFSGIVGTWTRAITPYGEQLWIDNSTRPMGQNAELIAQKARRLALADSQKSMESQASRSADVRITSSRDNPTTEGRAY